MKDILERIADSSPNESSHELLCRLHDCAHEIESLRRARAAAEGTHGTPTFQARVQPWMLECFGAEIAADRVERNHRFFEESAELVQSRGMTASEAHQLVDYVWSRPAGEPDQEVGGVMVTLAALCLANSLDMHAAGEMELARINRPDMLIRIRAKQASKPKHSPLPEHPASDQQALALLDSIINDMEGGFVKCENCGEQEDTATLDFMPMLRELRVMITQTGVGHAG